MFWKQKRPNQLSENKAERYKMAGEHENSMMANEVDQFLYQIKRLIK